MTLKEFLKVWENKNTMVCITALAFFKNSKKYYSFRTLESDRRIGSLTDEKDDYVLNLQVKKVHLNEDNSLYIDVIEWIDDEEYEVV